MSTNERTQRTNGQSDKDTCPFRWSLTHTNIKPYDNGDGHMNEVHLYGDHRHCDEETASSE